MIYIVPDLMRLASGEINDGISRNQIKILMGSVNKKNFIFLFAELVENFFLLRVAAPYKSEISADNKRVALFYILEFF